LRRTQNTINEKSSNYTKQNKNKTQLKYIEYTKRNENKKNNMKLKVNNHKTTH